MKDKVLKLKEICYSCQECPLGRRQVDGLDPHVFSSGKISSKIMFVGDAPEADEQRVRRPLMGRAGQFWENKVLAAAGLKRNDVYISNAVKCRTKNRSPFPAEIEICRQHLDAEVCLLKPKILIPMGNVPLQACCDIDGITKHRGKLRMSRIWSNEKQILVFPITHPTFGLRGSGLKETKIDAENIGKIYRALQQNIEITLDFFETDDILQVE